MWGPLAEICRATEELAPNRHQIISVPLYIPYSFMWISFEKETMDLKELSHEYEGG